MKRLLLIPVLLLQLASFAQTGKEVWKLVKVRDGDKLYPVSFKKSVFTISIKEKKFTGYIGCNKFRGKLQYAEGDNILPITMVSTKMACPDNLSSLEYATMEAVNLSDRLVITGSKAEFYNQTRLMLQLERAY